MVTKGVSSTVPVLAASSAGRFSGLMPIFSVNSVVLTRPVSCGASLSGSPASFSDLPPMTAS